MIIVHINPGDQKYLEDCGIEVRTFRHEQMSNVLTVASIRDMNKLCEQIIATGKVVEMVRRLNKNHA